MELGVAGLQGQGTLRCTQTAPRWWVRVQGGARLAGMLLRPGCECSAAAVLYMTGRCRSGSQTWLLDEALHDARAMPLIEHQCCQMTAVLHTAGASVSPVPGCATPQGRA